MTQELNQTECQVAKDDLWDNALSILAIPNKNNNNYLIKQSNIQARREIKLFLEK